MPFSRKSSNITKKVLNSLPILLIFIYRLLISPSRGVLRFLPGYPKQHCVFYPTCSEYALICFKTYSFKAAFLKTVGRVRRCHPGTPPTVDMP